jgi:sigma-B regulation protein RsbU (phosphoserine phosphatase)
VGLSDLTRSPKDEVSHLQQELAEREAELAIINSVQQALASRLEVQAIYDLVGDEIRDVFKAQVVMISTYDRETDTIEHRYAIERGQRVYAPGRFPNRGFRTQIVQTRKTVLVSTNVAEQAERLGQPTLPGTITPKTWLGVPMIVGDQVKGILSLQDIERENAYDDSDVRLLQTLAASMSVALENARLWEQEKLHRKALEREFEIGREIQAGFLPDTIPQPQGWEIAASLQSAREVAGDFYDVFELTDGTIGLVIADVCDKGLGAALFMTLFRSLIRALSSMSTPALPELTGGLTTSKRLKNAVSLTNNYVAVTHDKTSMFATIFLGILDPRTGVLAYVNGGHVPPMLINQHGVREILKRTGPAVGVILDADFAIREVVLEQGDILFGYTDGLTDAANAAGEFLSEMSLVPCLVGSQPLASMLEHVLKLEEDFSTGTQQVDDITMLAVRRLGA